MTDKAVSRRRENAAFFLRILAFGLIFTLISCAVLYVLTPKYDYGPGSMMNLPLQPRNTIDVLAVGTSTTYAAVNTNVLWANWGFSVYDLASAEQQYWHTYYYLGQALTTQHPKILLLDAKAATYPDDTTRRGRTILSTSGILNPIRRANAIATGGQQPLDFLLGYPQVHENWKSLTAENFAFPGWTGGRSVDWKGFIECDKMEHHTKPTFFWTETGKKINGREAEYFERICDLCEAQGIQIILISYPSPDYENDHMYICTLRKMAEERGIPLLNFNNPKGRFGIRYSSDFADWQHLNVKGSIKLSLRIGEYLEENYDLTDHRGDPQYDSWQRCLEEWQAAYPEMANMIRNERKEKQR